MSIRTVKRSLILLFVGGIVIFGVVWRITPEFAQSILELQSFAAPYIAEAAAPEPKKEPEPKAKKVARKPVKAKAPSPVAAPEISAPAYAERQIPVPAVEIRQPAMPTLGPTEFKVALENAELYSSNSSTGTVVRRLNRGEIVDLQFRVNNAGPEWMYVNVANPRGAGFVRSDVVSKQDPTMEQASR